MRRPTKKQLLLVELVDQGAGVEQIASRTGKLVALVHKQLNRIRRKAREGHFAPSPLIEQAAMTSRVYLAGFNVSAATRSVTVGLYRRRFWPQRESDAGLHRTVPRW
jgi:hypothetical protein